MAADIWQPDSPALPINVEGTLVQEQITGIAGQTLIPLSLFTYVPGTDTIIVFINGVFQNPTEYTQTSSSSITLNGALSAGDIVLVIGFPLLDLSTVVPGKYLFLEDTVTQPPVTPGFGTLFLDSAANKLKLLRKTGVVQTIPWEVGENLFSYLTAAEIADYESGARTLDLTTPMQTWLTACLGKIAILPKGNAKITSALNVPSAIKIVGAGWGTGITGYDCTIFTVPAGAALIQIQDLILSSRDAGGGADPRTKTAIEFLGAYVNRCNFITIKNLYLQGWNTGINLEYTWYSSIDNIYTISTNISLRYVGQCVNNSVTNSYLVVNGGSRSIDLLKDAGHRGEGFVASNCVLASGGGGVYSDGFLDMAFYGCTVDQIAGIGFDLTGVEDFVFDGPWVYCGGKCFDFNDAGGAFNADAFVKVGRCTTTGNDSVVYIGLNNKGIQVHNSSLIKSAGVGYPIDIQGAEASVLGVHIVNGGTSIQDIYVNAADVQVNNITGNNLVNWNVTPVKSVASVAGAMTLPQSAVDVYTITGNNAITSIPVMGFDGKRVTLISTGGTWTLTDGGNLLLNGNFVATGNDSITIACNGANWYEVSRSPN